MHIPQHIIDLAASGDAPAFEQIVTCCSEPVFRYVCNVVGDRHYAEDVAQRVFLNIHRHLRKFDPTRGSFATWVFRIARNAAFNHLRDQKRVQTAMVTPLPEPSTDLTPQTYAEMREQFALLDAAVAELPPNQRSVWVLCELEGLTQAQIAAIEDIPEGTVKSRVSRAREALKKKLGNRIELER